MSEESSLIYCSQCGSANPSTFKFCSNCGAKLEQPMKQEPVSEEAKQPDEPVYERADAEVVSEGKVPLTQDELNINYDTEAGSYSSGSYDSSGNLENTRQSSYTGPNISDVTSQANGNGGFAIASMVCGILSIVCCCLTWLGLVLAIAAVVLGIIALNGKYDGKGMAIAGIITGGIGIILWLIVVIAMGSAGVFTTFLNELSGY